MKPVRVVIVGGGTAGWMTAAALAGILNERICTVRLVESEEIGTVGVGEATLPQMRVFNDAVGLIEADMMRRTNATFKLGIEFVDWGYKGSSYIHPFGAHGRPTGGVAFHHQWLRARQNGRDDPIEAFSFAIQAARRNRFDFPDSDPASVAATFDYAYHFDASLYAAYLRAFAERRGVARTEGRVVDVSRDGESGDIDAITLASGETIEGDLFVDCSGFRGLLIGQTMESPWEDWTKWLPCDRAFAVPSERLDVLAPYTRATAHEAGWQWRIPLQHRTGNGHIFSSAFIGEDQAADTLMRNLPSAALGESRILRFQAGRRSRSWQRNCVAIGLSSGFLEPLESTSIYLIQVAAMALVKLFPQAHVDPALAAEYNRTMDVEYARIRDFLILHYHANSRDDGEMWRHCREMAVPDSLAEKIALFRERGFIPQYKDGLFSPPSWISVFLGQGVANEHYHPLADGLPLPRLFEELDRMRRQVDEGVAALPMHETTIEDYCEAPDAARLAETA
jgi:tryptophan 7-halogenase